MRILNANNPEHIKEAADILKGGGIVAFPTETVYGLGGLVRADSIAKIYAAKERPAYNPLIVHVQNAAEALKLFDWEKAVPGAYELAVALAEAFWPGPLTIVAPKVANIPFEATAGLSKVAVRVPEHPVANALLRAVGAPLVAPSANASTRPSATLAEHVVRTLSGRIDAVLDGGMCAEGLESTVIDITDENPRILRFGALPVSKIAAMVPKLVLPQPGTQTHRSEGSPGQAALHYAPKVAQVQVCSLHELKAHWHSGCAILLRRETAFRLDFELGPRALAHAFTEVLPDDAEGFGRGLFAALYRIEEAQPATLLLENQAHLQPQNAWLAVQDRLLRAAAKRD